jgi:hypothetical protein
VYTYVEYETDNNGRYVYIDDEQTTRRIVNCHGIRLIFDVNRTIVYDPSNPAVDHDASIAGQFINAFQTAAQRIELMEDAITLAQKPRCWRSKEARPTLDEIHNWITSEKYRKINEEAWDRFNGQCIIIADGKPASLVNVIPAAGRITKVATDNKVCYRPNAIKPIMANTAYVDGLAPSESNIQKAQDVHRAYKAAKDNQKKYAIDKLIEQARSKQSNPHRIQMKSKATITPVSRKGWHDTVTQTYARVTTGFAIPTDQLPEDIHEVITHGRRNTRFGYSRRKAASNNGRMGSRM